MLNFKRLRKSFLKLLAEGEANSNVDEGHCIVSTHRAAMF